jgi:oxygen-dependent protoporphyrinogen oxidase
MSPVHLPNLHDTPAFTPHVVIVGGGISGLSAAFYLQRAARAAGGWLRYTLVERDERFGGKIQTDTIAGAAGEFIVEGGPDSFITQKPWGLQLALDLGLEDRLLGTNQARHAVYVLVNGRPRPMPDGMMLIVPTRLMPFLRSPLLSLRGKLRMALDLCIPPRRDAADETLADFIRRRLGAEALDKLAEPLLAGIHSAEPELQSLLATFPRFRALEETYGSLIRGMLAQRRPSTTDQQPASIISRSSFVTLRGGVGELVRALLDALDGRLIAGRGVAAIDHDSTAALHERPYRVLLDDGETLDADALILTTPAFAAADLVAPFQPALANALRQIRYVTTGTVSLAYHRADLGALLDGFGLVIPHSEGRRINALTISSIKFDHRAPTGDALLRVFVGGSRNPEVPDLDDAALLALVRTELRDILGIAVEPLWSRIYRWPRANPQYDLGHLDRMDALDGLLPAGLYLSGSAYRGVGIPDCVRQGQEAAEKVVAQLSPQMQLMRDVVACGTGYEHR